MKPLADPAPEPRSATDRMPPAVRGAVLAALAVLVGGALAIVAVRGPAILIDLAATASRWLCL